MRVLSGDPGPLRRAVLLTLVVSCVYTALVVAAPGSGIGVLPPGTRGLIEITGLFLVLVAALILAIPDEDEIAPARNAFVTALTVIAITNAFLGVAPTVGLVGTDQVAAFYPWVAARYVAGVLFVLAAVGRPRTTIWRYIAAAVVVLGCVDATMLAFGDRLPELVEPPVSGAGGPLVVTRPVIHATVQLVPGALFAMGAVIAGRLHRRSGAPVLLALAVALVAQVFTQIHQVLLPSFLGRTVTSADAFRMASFLALFVGAVQQVRLLYAERSTTVRVREADLLASDVLAEELTRILDREEDFRAVVSHELATPLATIRALVHVVARALDAASPATRDAMAGIRAETRRLSELVARVDELRDLERVDFSCELRPVRLRPLLGEVATFVRGLTGEHPVELQAPNVRILADPVRFGQALRNVVANAARYAPAGTPIGIEARREGDRVLVAVSDSGPGIPAHERADVLRPYARGADGRRVPGTGLGLYVASRIIEAHGGRLLIEDAGGRPGTGARVVLDVASATSARVPGTG